jgi:hypothetical protein
LTLFWGGVKNAARLPSGTRRRENALEWSWSYFNGELIRLTQHTVALTVGVASFFVHNPPPSQQLTHSQKVFGVMVIAALFWMNMGAGINTVRSIRGFYRRKKILEAQVSRRSSPVGNIDSKAGERRSQTSEPKLGDGT